MNVIPVTGITENLAIMALAYYGEIESQCGNRRCGMGDTFQMAVFRR
jgi:hypothetical protein